MKTMLGYPEPEEPEDPDWAELLADPFFKDVTGPLNADDLAEKMDVSYSSHSSAGTSTSAEAAKFLEATTWTEKETTNNATPVLFGASGSCQWCQTTHGAVCPYVKAVEFYENGTVKRIEFK